MALCRLQSGTNVEIYRQTHKCSEVFLVPLNRSPRHRLTDVGDSDWSMSGTSILGGLIGVGFHVCFLEKSQLLSQVVGFVVNHRF